MHNATHSLTRIICYILSLFILFMIASDAFGKKKKIKKLRKFPHGCREVGYQFNGDILNLTSNGEDHPQTLFLIHNKSKNTIRMTVKKPMHRSYFPHYTNKIRGKNWAAFAMDDMNLQFHCQVQVKSKNKPHHSSCAQSLEICQYTRAKFPDTNYGNYWSVNSSTRRNTINSAIRQGILLRW